MGLKVKHTPLFEKTLDSIFENVPLYYSEGIVMNLLSEIDEYKSILIINPLMGQLEPGFEDIFFQLRRIVIKPYFKLIYSVSDDFIVFHDIWDTRRNPTILKNQLVWNL